MVDVPKELCPWPGPLDRIYKKVTRDYLRLTQVKYGSWEVPLSLLLMRSLESVPWLHHRRSIGDRPEKEIWLVLRGSSLLITRKLTPVMTLAKDNKRCSSAIVSAIVDEPPVLIIPEACVGWVMS